MVYENFNKSFVEKINYGLIEDHKIKNFKLEIEEQKYDYLIRLKLFDIKEYRCIKTNSLMVYHIKNIMNFFLNNFNAIKYIESILDDEETYLQATFYFNKSEFGNLNLGFDVGDIVKSKSNIYYTYKVTRITPKYVYVVAIDTENNNKVDSEEYRIEKNNKTFYKEDQNE